MDPKKSDVLKRAGEGRASYNEVLPEVTPSVFVRMIVLDVISDPNTDLQDPTKSDQWIEMKVSNIRYAPVLPRNTIVARRVSENSKPMFVFPFFPSHLSLPCKPGECVWVMFERPESSRSDMAFWFSRVIEPHISDDVNHSHPGRSYETSLYPDTKQVASSDNEVWHELRNSPVITTKEDRFSSNSGMILPGEPDDIFETLITQTNAALLVSYEEVPRFRKRPGDVVLEGTNNSLIVLGTDRVGSIERKESEFSSYAGSIDLVTGRGQTSKTFGKSASTTSVQDASGKTKGTELKKELDKSLNSLSTEEGDPDFVNDRSRILVSQKTSVDSNFNLSSYSSKAGVNDSADGDAAIVVKSDKLRFIARSDIEIIVTGYEYADSPNGDRKKDEYSDLSKWASVIIKSNGDIVMRPADTGVIKLGGDDANLAVLCEKAVIPTPGTVTCPGGITDTMGGIQGLAPEGGTGQGTFATKVLLK